MTRWKEVTLRVLVVAGGDARRSTARPWTRRLHFADDPRAEGKRNRLIVVLVQGGAKQSHASACKAARRQPMGDSAIRVHFLIRQPLRAEALRLLCSASFAPS